MVAPMVRMSAPMAPMPPMPPMAPMAPMEPMRIHIGSDEGQNSAMTCVTTDESNVKCTTTPRAKVARGGQSGSYSYSYTPEARAERSAREGGREIDFDGLRMTSVSPALASYFGAGSEKGLLVLEASSEWAPLVTGDIVLTHNGRAVLRDGKNYSISMNTDEDNTFTVLRKGKKLTVTVKAQ